MDAAFLLSGTTLVRLKDRSLYPSGNVIGTVDNQDRLLAYGLNTYAYTGNGELKLKVTGVDSTKYRYDAFGNLRDVYLPTGDHIEYVIDAQQRRIGRKLNGAFQKGWLYQTQLAIAAEVDVSGTVTKTFEYATHGNVPDWMYANGVPYRIVTDHLGSVRLVVDLNGTVAQRIDYDAYGRVLNNTNPGFQPFGYAGGLLDDATGLTRFGARDYDAETGRWTTKDPVDFEGEDTNLYAYVGGVPVGSTDPMGKWPVPIPDIRDLLTRRVVNFSAGFGDALLFGQGPRLRSWFGIVNVEECTAAYQLGELAGEVAEALAVASISGPAGPLFGRARYSNGVGGIFNRGPVRVGWSWNQRGRFGARNYFGVHGGTPGTAGHWHFTPIPGPRGPLW
jgi:RHS repeat-associated protein